jgi:uncharacterized protein
MPLTSHAMLEAMESGQLTITPFTQENLNSHSYDLTLAPKLIVYTEAVLSPKSKNATKEFEIPDDLQEKVLAIIDSMSFSSGKVPESLEGKIVQDADRLDSIGAIGIARAFAFGGSKNRPMYQPEVGHELHSDFETYANAKSHTINHFYEKLLLLKSRLHTPTAIHIGEERHAFMEQFLNQFYREWNGKND